MTIYEGHGVTLHHADCLDVLRSLPDCSVDSVVTDPPYALGFMGREWDTFGMDVGRGAQARSQRRAEVTPTGEGHSTSAGPYLASGVDSLRAAGAPFQRWCEAWATECLRVLKPGGHLLAFGGTRTWHRLACAVEDAGFEVRDSIAWLYGSGFPKSLDVSKAIDKAAGAEREVLSSFARKGRSAGILGTEVDIVRDVTAPATPEAKAWEGWGTALKPSHEPVCVAVKPHSTSDILAEIGSHLARLEDECRQHASDAARSSAPTPADSPEARTDSAPASAATQPEAEPESATPTGVAAGSSAQTATSASESMGATCWSTVTSWKACWAELCELTSTSTTSTTTGLTTDLRTLWSSMSSLTVTSTPDSPTPRLTSSSIASAVDSLFAATVLSLRATLALSAAGSATGSTPRSPLDAAEGSPAFEPVVVARKPLQSTVAANVLAWGTGALNVDGCRIEHRDADDLATSQAKNPGRSDTVTSGVYGAGRPQQSVNTAGRWPANVVLDETQAEALDEQSGEAGGGTGRSTRGGGNGGDWNPTDRTDKAGQTVRGDGREIGYGDSGGASRFFYVAKADASERPKVNGTAHPTVKPLALMRWLVRLVTPPGGTVLEPFAGSGTTVEACIVEGFQCIAIEREADYLPLIRQRIDRRRDPVEALRGQAADLGLFDLLGGDGA